jgi:aryl-alcohol dehydrogenase-like predicted oxidoreductase
MFNGEEFQRNLDFVDAIRPAATRLGCGLADLVLAWTAEQPGITCVLFGATSPEQVRDNCNALACTLDDDQLRERLWETIEKSLAKLGVPKTRIARVVGSDDARQLAKILQELLAKD